MKMAHYKIAIIAILVTNSFWSLSPYWAKWPCPDNQLSHLHLLVFLGRVTSSFVYQLFTSFFYLQYRNLKMNWKFSWYWPMGHQPIQFSYSLTVLNPSLDGVFSFIDFLWDHYSKSLYNQRPPTINTISVTRVLQDHLLSVIQFALDRTEQNHTKLLLEIHKKW